MRIFVITKRTLIIAAAIIAAIAAAVILALSFSDGPVSPTAAMAEVEEYEMEVLAGKKKELPVYSVEREDKKIAITIDAAWEDDKTQFILDTFKDYDVKATFFLCGFWTDKYSDEVKQIAEMGHEIGNHTATHPHMNSISVEQIRQATRESADPISKRPGKLAYGFRAPWRSDQEKVITTMRSFGYEVIQWDIDTIDTDWNKMLRRLKNRLTIYLFDRYDVSLFNYYGSKAQKLSKKSIKFLLTVKENTSEERV